MASLHSYMKNNNKSYYNERNTLKKSESTANHNKKQTLSELRFKNNQVTKSTVFTDKKPTILSEKSFSHFNSYQKPLKRYQKQEIQIPQFSTKQGYQIRIRGAVQDTKAIEDQRKLNERKKLI